MHPENQVNVFLSHSGARPLGCAPVPNSGDTLLVFNSLALYVDRNGHRARDTELMYTAHPLHHGEFYKHFVGKSSLLFTLYRHALDYYNHLMLNGDVVDDGTRLLCLDDCYSLLT